MSDAFSGNRDFDSSNFIRFLWAWRIPILILMSIAFVASLIFSSPFFITPKYKSVVVLYPVSTSSVSKALLSETYGGKEDIMEFGEDEQTEQMLQILNSNRIRDRIIAKYDLMSHYEIDPGSKFKLTRLYKQYESNITYRRTEYNAVKITVMDQNSQLAADIANDIANLLDSIKIDMQRQRAIQGFKIVEAEYLQRLGEIHRMEDSLTYLRKKGVHDYETQAEMINQQLAIEIAKDNRGAIRALEDKLDTLAKYGGPYVSLRDALEHEKKQLSVLKSKYEEAKVDAEEELPQKFVVSTAYGAERKSYPVRWLIVLVSTLSVFLLTVLVIIIIENVSKSGLYDSSQKKKFKFNIRIPQVDFKIKRPRGIQLSISNHNNKWKMEHFFSNINLLQLLWKWKWHMIIICLVAGVIAAIFSGPAFIKPRFKSVGVIYPSNIAPYSDESETEQMVQWLNSKDIKDSIINKFNLAKHYKIDSSYKYFYSTILYKYSKNVQISKTMYESVEIVVTDSDPRIACDMVNEIINQFNKKVQAIHREKYLEVVSATKAMLDAKKREIDSVEAKLYEIRTQYEIIDYANQTREVARGYLRTVDGDNAARNINTAEVIKLKKNIEEKGGEYVYYNTRLYDLLRLYGVFQEDYDRAVFDANKTFTHANIVTPPVVADKKSYPVRWIIVFLTMASTLLLTTVLVVIFDSRLNEVIHKG
ncbi:MAG: Wzz/FepE/Etk N-terminal domain-containing protein [Bacteroidales bacterium]|nr:hypothetical protein [Lentimicrobiaceae bacterium]MDD5694709.1 Wzz/FepE/Etk N-terminal domain-containing protein [Bacteroidales bacterium]